MPHSDPNVEGPRPRPTITQVPLASDRPGTNVVPSADLNTITEIIEVYSFQGLTFLCSQGRTSSRARDVGGLPFLSSRRALIIGRLRETQTRNRRSAAAVVRDLRAVHRLCQRLWEHDEVRRREVDEDSRKCSLSSSRTRKRSQDREATLVG